MRIFTDSGDVAIAVEGPGGHVGAMRLACLLTFRTCRQCLFDVLVVGYFENGGLYGMQISYEHGVSSGWQELLVPTTRIVDMKMSRGKCIDGEFSIHSLLLLQ
jgi:hypothetical protein